MSRRQRWVWRSSNARADAGARAGMGWGGAEVGGMGGMGGMGWMGRMEGMERPGATV